jgi:hypothetical protein
MLSVHRLDVSKHLFYPSANEARFVGGDGEAVRPRPPTTETLQELPAPCAIFSDATTAAARARRRSTAFFSLVSPRSSDGSRIRFTNEAGDSIMYDADEGCFAMPCPDLEEFAGPVVASVSVVAQQAGGGGAAAKEESMYIVHGVRDGVARFHVLRFGTPPPKTDLWGGSTYTYRSTRVGEGWFWQSLPPPPFVSDDGPDDVISSYTVVEGGRTICVSSSLYAAAARHLVLRHGQRRLGDAVRRQSRVFTRPRPLAGLLLRCQPREGAVHDVRPLHMGHAHGHEPATDVAAACLAR